MRKLEFLTKHRTLIDTLVNQENLGVWMADRTNTEIHILAHFMYFCHIEALALAPYLYLEAKKRGIDRQQIPIEDL